MGTDGLFAYLDKYDIELDSHFDGVLGRYIRKPWNKFITPENQKYVLPESLDFLDGLLRYDHQVRFTSKEAQDHPYFGKILLLYFKNLFVI